MTDLMQVFESTDHVCGPWYRSVVHGWTGCAVLSIERVKSGGPWSGTHIHGNVNKKVLRKHGLKQGAISLGNPLLNIRSC